MKTSLDNRKAEEASEDTEITLGTGSLLAIFFGIVLLCGLIFGFGYSLGRHKGPEAAAPVAEAGHPTTPKTAGSAEHAAPSPTESDATTAVATDAPAQAADSANPNFPANYTPPSPDEAGGEDAPARVPHSGEAANANRKPGPADRRSAAIGRSPSATPPATDATPVSSSSSAPLMVQIAAVSRPEDAQVLAAALRKRGFSPMVRHGLADEFYHIQVGPFTDRTQAESVKQRLMADGYNAILR